MSKDNENIITKKSGYVHVPVENLPGGGQVRETFKVDPSGNISDGHTTIEVPGGQKTHLPWEDKKE